MMNRPFGTLDHVIIGTPDLDCTVQKFAADFGVQPSFGGSHPDHGTSNYLIGLGERCYLELVGSPGSDDQLDPLGRRIQKLPGERLIGLAFESEDLARVAFRAEELGLKVGNIKPGCRHAAYGQMLEWRTVHFDNDVFPELLVFAIDWGRTPHPSGGLPSLALQEIHVTSKDIRAQQFINELMGARVDVATSNLATGLSCSITSDAMAMRYSSSGDPVTALIAA